MTTQFFEDLGVWVSFMIDQKGENMFFSSDVPEYATPAGDNTDKIYNRLAAVCGEYVPANYEALAMVAGRLFAAKILDAIKPLI